MNYSLAILWCIFLTLGMYLVFIIITMWVTTIRSQPRLVLLPSSSNQCGGESISTLPDFSSLKNCNNPSLQYRGTKWYPQSNFVVSPVQVSYLSVCGTACGKSGLSAFGKCVDVSLQSDYDKCVTSLLPKGCNSLSFPVGKIGNTPYYANYVGEGLCFS